MISMKNTGKEKKFKYKRVRLYWQDIVSNSEWMTLEKAKDQTFSWCEYTGYLYIKIKRKLSSLLHIVLMRMMVHLQLAIQQHIQDQLLKRLRC